MQKNMGRVLHDPCFFLPINALFSFAVAIAEWPAFDTNREL